MTREYRVSNRPPADDPSQRKVPPLGQDFLRKVSGSASKPPVPAGSPHPPAKQRTVPPKPPAPNPALSSPSASSGSAGSPPSNQEKQRSAKRQNKKNWKLASPFKGQWPRWFFNWPLLIIFGMLSTGITGLFALSLLLELPGLPNCPAIFWPLASASVRFECARLAANKQTIPDLSEAIKLIDSLPSNHPLREEADRLVEQWSKDLLRLADEAFNAGKLDEAIAAARRIPAKSSAARLVEEHIQRWRTIWSKAEATYRKAEDAMRKLNWRQAFAEAVRLLDLDNTYWQTTKYQELTSQINKAREEGNQLAKAQRLADDGGLDNFLAALKLAQAINPKSYVYQAAQQAIGKIGEQMLDLAQASLDRQDLQDALKILGKLPTVTKVQESAKDLSAIAQAQSQSWLGTVAGLEDAISQARRIGSDRPLYQKAQQLITRWQQEIEAIAQLDNAKALALPGTIESLRAAIAQASTIPRSNPKWKEVQRQSQTWTNQVQTLEDRPILDQAEQFSMSGDIPALQAAIAQASQIGRDRALYKDARTKIEQWTAQIQRIEDQPILEQARAYASAGDLETAIRIAEQIQSGRALYSDAQSDLRTWKQSIRAAAVRAQSEAILQDARGQALSGTIDGLSGAIQMADQVPASSELRADADNLIRDWSRQILQTAENRANYDILGAIAIAQKVPPRSPLYAEAQQKIKGWQSLSIR